MAAIAKRSRSVVGWIRKTLKLARTPDVQTQSAATNSDHSAPENYQHHASKHDEAKGGTLFARNRWLSACKKAARSAFDFSAPCGPRCAPKPSTPSLEATCEGETWDDLSSSPRRSEIRRDGSLINRKLKITKRLNIARIPRGEGSSQQISRTGAVGAVSAVSVGPNTLCNHGLRSLQDGSETNRHGEPNDTRNDDNQLQPTSDPRQANQRTIPNSDSWIAPPSTLSTQQDTVARTSGAI
ncbi:hypothetical protein FRC07_004755, partial [Ceratobasidium sp. 392]